MDIRCDEGKIKFAEIGPGWIEFKCKSRYCGWEKGSVVIHRFDSSTAKLLSTQKFAEPQRKESVDGNTVRHP